MSQHCRANPCCGDVPCRGVPVPQHASGYPSFNPPASTDLREENERLEAERAEQWRLRREMEASRDMERALAATLSAENAALKERLQRVEGLVQRAKAILPQFYEDWHECVAAALAREGK